MPMTCAAGPCPAAADTRGARLRSQALGRREHVLAAARSAFFERGLEGTSLREIAKRAGYTPGALYSYFGSKEEVYGALLGESLQRLNDRVQAAVPAAVARARPRALREVARAGAAAFFDFYLRNPGDLELGFYLFHGLRPRGLTPALNERLNGRLREALAPVSQALAGLGLPADEAQTEVTALFAHVVGLLLLNHTGRIRMFDRQTQALFDRYLQAMLDRAGGPVRKRGAAR